MSKCIEWSSLPSWLIPYSTFSITIIKADTATKGNSIFLCILPFIPFHPLSCTNISVSSHNSKPKGKMNSLIIYPTELRKAKKQKSVQNSLNGVQKSPKTNSPG